VMFALTLPARTYMDRANFVQQGRWLLDQIDGSVPRSNEEQAAIHTLEERCELIQSPLQRIEHRLQPWVVFLVMPLFAFSNAGVHILGNVLAAAKNSISLGVALGLFVGKPIGIFLFAWLSTKLRLAAQPKAVSWPQIFGCSWICGIGFTMSLFIASLAFGQGTLLDLAKIGTLAASLGAALCGSIFLLRCSQRAA
jgi:NhaA family Na+:H+ antiporter